MGRKAYGLTDPDVATLVRMLRTRGLPQDIKLELLKKLRAKQAAQGIPHINGSYPGQQSQPLINH